MELTANSVDDVIKQGHVILDFCATSEKFAKASEESHEALSQLEACISMLQDLSACVESLKEVGATDQWLDIVNKDNRFVIACNIELPKFLEGSKTRTEACMEGALDTLKMWAEKAWKVIVWIFNTIVSMARTAMELMNRKTGRTLQETVDNLKKAAKRAEAGTYPELNVTITDFNILRRYITEITDLCLIIEEEVNKPNGVLRLTRIANQDPDGNVFKIKTGDTRMDVTSALITLLCEKKGKNKNADLEYYGYIITREGIEFKDPNAIPKIDVNLTDYQIEQIQAVFEMAKSNDFKHCQNMLADLLRRLLVFQANLERFKEDAINKIRSGVITNPMDPQDFTDAIGRVKTFYTIINRIVIQLYALSVRATDELTKITNVLKRAGK
jgi:hypothetical protein